MDGKNLMILHSGFILASFAMIGWGISAEDVLTSQILITCGGAILGGSFSTILGVWHSKKMYDLLVENAHSHFSSKEDEIKNFRKFYHIYWVSSRDGKYVWMHAEMDFSKSNVPGKLQADFISHTPEGKNAHYKSEAIVRGKRLITLDQAMVGNEPPAILVYPNFGIAYNPINYGFGYFETFDNKEALSPVILSETIMEGWKKMGYIDAETSTKLWDRWEKNIEVARR